MRAFATALGASVVVAILAPLSACAPDESSEPNENVASAFQPLSTDQIVDPTDPPTDPDPPDAPGFVEPEEIHALAKSTSSSRPASCPAYDKLSPRGLTFVIDIVDSTQFQDLLLVKSFIRARDVLVVRPETGPVAALKKNFPCNRIAALAYPSELDHLNDLENKGVDAVVLDWEGVDQEQSASAQSSQLAAIKQEILNHKMQSAMAPGTDWVATAADASYDYVLAQTQPACRASVANFGDAANRVANDAKTELGIRNAAVEISVDSSASNAGNYVDAERGADCARAGYGSGARAIYVFGQQKPQLVPFFHRLAQLGVRSPQ